MSTTKSYAARYIDEQLPMFMKHPGNVSLSAFFEQAMDVGVADETRASIVKFTYDRLHSQLKKLRVPYVVRLDGGIWSPISTDVFVVTEAAKYLKPKADLTRLMESRMGLYGCVICGARSEVYMQTSLLTNEDEALVSPVHWMHHVNSYGVNRYPAAVSCFNRLWPVPTGEANKMAAAYSYNAAICDECPRSCGTCNTAISFATPWPWLESFLDERVCGDCNKHSLTAVLHPKLNRSDLRRLSRSFVVKR